MKMVLRSGVHFFSRLGFIEFPSVDFIYSTESNKKDFILFYRSIIVRNNV